MVPPSLTLRPEQLVPHACNCTSRRCTAVFEVQRHRLKDVGAKFLATFLSVANFED